MTADKMTEKLAKLKALAENGVGGEKETARRMYEDLKAKYSITDEMVAAVRKPTAQEVKQEFSTIAFSLWVLASNLAEEMQDCMKCSGKPCANAPECVTFQNRKDLERQYEALKTEFERGVADG